jgi:hypothetical protein
MAGKPHPDGVEIHQPNNANSLLPSPMKFGKYGECGIGGDSRPKPFVTASSR